MKKLILKNSWLDILIKVLDGNLPFTRSRKRKVFVDILNEKIKAREKNRIELLEKFSKKDEKKQSIISDGKYQIDNIDEFNKEFITLYNEDVVIDIPPSIEESIVVVMDLVKNTDIVVTDAETVLIEEIIKSFDEIKSE